MKKQKVSFVIAALLGVGFISLPLKADVHTITISGISGEVTGAIEYARPKDSVEVRVCPADLFNYEYAIEKTEEKLQEGFSIVGAGPQFDLTGGAGTIAAVADDNLKDRELCKHDKLDDLLLCYKILRSKIGESLNGVEEAVKIVKEAVSPAAFDAVDCTAQRVQWPDAIKKVVGEKSTFSQNYRQQSDNLEKLEKNRALLLEAIEDEEYRGLAAKPPATEDPLLARIKQDLETIKGPIAKMQASLDEAQKHATRLAYIRSHNEQPILSQKFLMPETSTRFTIGVKRKPITAEARTESTETDPAKIQAMQFKSITFENRSLHRFNVSMGMVGVGRPDNRDFEVVSSLNAEGTTVYHVRESKRDVEEFEAATFLGIYFRPVDNYAPTRDSAWMVMLGTEISASPSDFFLGLGLDTPRGVVFGFGITEYEGVSPGKGWRVGQEVPAIATGTDAGKPKIATVPKERQDTIGAYLFLGFRPSIFKAFLDRRK